MDKILNNQINYNQEDVDNEAIQKNSELIKINEFLYHTCKSLCKIITSKYVGSGFLIKLYIFNEPFYCLMSNEHVINKEMIKSKDNIEVYYDNQHKKIIINLDKNERFIQVYRYLNIDLTVVEILEKDKVDEYYFLLPNLDYINKYEELKNKKIYIIQFPEGKELSYSFGKIYNIKQYEFSHLSSTKKGSSGSPIFLENSSLVIGIHKNTNKNKPENYGNFIG